MPATPVDNIVRRPVTQEMMDVQRELAPVMPLIKNLVDDHSFKSMLAKFATVKQVNRTYKKVPTQTDKTSYMNPSMPGGTPINKSSKAIPLHRRISVDVLDRMVKDPQIKLGIIVVMGIIRGLGWSIDCANQSQKKFLKFAINRIYPQLIRSLRCTLLFGFSSNEIVYERRHVIIRDVVGKDGDVVTFFDKPDALIVKYMKDHYPSSIKIVRHTSTERFLGIAQSKSNGDVTYLKYGPRLFFYAIDDHFGNYFGEPRIAGAYAPWFWSQAFMEFMAAYMERRGTPQLIVNYPFGRRIDVDGDEVDAKDVALEIGTSLLANSVAAVPTEFEDGNAVWNVKYLTDDKRADMFERVLNYFDVLKLRGLGIPDRALAQELLPGGTSAGTESSRDLMLTTMSGLTEELQSAINTQILPVLQHQNFPEDEIIDAEFVFHDPAFSNRRIAKELLVEQLRQTPNMINTGRIPDMVPSIRGILKMLNIPADDVDAAYRSAIEDVQAVRSIGSRRLAPSERSAVTVTPEGDGANGNE